MTPRISVSLTAETHALFERVKTLSKETGAPYVKIIWACVAHCLTHLEANKDKRETDIPAGKIKL